MSYYFLKYQKLNVEVKERNSTDKWHLELALLTWRLRHLEPGQLSGSRSLIPTIVPMYLQEDKKKCRHSTRYTNILDFVAIISNINRSNHCFEKTNILETVVTLHEYSTKLKDMSGVEKRIQEDLNIQIPALPRFLCLKHHSKPHTNRNLGSIYRFSVLGQRNNKFWWACPIEKLKSRQSQKQNKSQYIYI